MKQFFCLWNKIRKDATTMRKLIVKRKCSKQRTKTKNIITQGYRRLHKLCPIILVFFILQNLGEFCVTKNKTPEKLQYCPSVLILFRNILWKVQRNGMNYQVSTPYPYHLKKHPSLQHVHRPITTINPFIQAFLKPQSMTQLL